MDEKSQFWEELPFIMVFGPFAVALSLFGFSLTFMAGRLLVDVVLNGGKAPVCVGSADR